tara:strand:+ start:689 stop:1498 length:810 start_codon:yes stop_codon:yes gene_type:complete
MGVADKVSAAEWATDTIEIKFLYRANETPFALEVMEDFLTRGAWEVNERLNVGLIYDGLTTVKGRRDGRITVIWAGESTIENVGCRITASGCASWMYEVGSDSDIANALIYFNWDRTVDDFECMQRLVNHEILHAVAGTEHSDNEHDVMYGSSLGDCRHTISENDMKLADRTPDSPCFSALTSELDIYIPNVRIDSLDTNMGVALEYIGAETWRVSDSTIDVSVTPCSGVTVDHLTFDIEFSDVRTVDAQVAAGLVYNGDDTWSLSYIN